MEDSFLNIFLYLLSLLNTSFVIDSSERLLSGPADPEAQYPQQHVPTRDRAELSQSPGRRIYCTAQIFIWPRNQSVGSMPFYMDPDPNFSLWFSHPKTFYAMKM